MVPLDALVAHNAVEPVARVLAARALVHRLVLPGLVEHDEAAVDGLARGRELCRAGGHAGRANDGLVRVRGEPGRGVDVLFDVRAGFVVGERRRGGRGGRGVHGWRRGRGGVQCARGARGRLDG